MPTITETIRAKARQATQTETRYAVAKRAGVHWQVLDRFLDGNRDPRGSTLDKLAEALDLELTSRKPRKR